MLLGVAALTLFSVTPAWANSPKLTHLIGQVAQQEGLDPNLLKAVVAIESKFDTTSVSTKGAVGLMQLMPETARLLGVNDRFNPEENLRGGARYLRQMMEKYPESLPLALAAYNAGPSTVSRFGGVPPFPATKRYINNVLSYFAKTVPGSNHSPKKIYQARKKQKGDTTATPILADAHQRIVRLLGDDDAEGVPTIRSPRPVPLPKAVHTSKKSNKSRQSAQAGTPGKASAASRVIPYVPARHVGAQYQAKNTPDASEEIPVVVLRR
ncbi:MAG: lytic transglycosylase domain-containing protein [Magnetococcus sp. XQGC-1]